MNLPSLVITTIVAFALLLGQFEPALLGERDMSFATVSKGVGGGFKESKILARAEGDAMFIELHMGEFPTGGYTLEVKNIKEYPDRVIVKVERTYPGHCPVTQALTQPFHIIKIPRTEKQILFEYSDRTMMC